MTRSLFRPEAAQTLIGHRDGPPEIAMEASLSKLNFKLGDVVKEGGVMLGGLGGWLASVVADGVDSGRHPVCPPPGVRAGF